MTARHRIEAPAGTRELGADAFPLAVGGTDADIPVPGLDRGEPVAHIGLQDGEPFVQPHGDAGRVSLAGHPVTGSQWLRDGDELRVAATRVRVRIHGDGVRLRVEQLPIDDPTEPPRLVSAVATPGGPRVAPPLTAPAPADAVVRPVAFRPRPLALGGAPRVRLWRRRVAAALVLVPLALAAAFVFGAGSVELRVEPEPETLAVRGWPHLRLGGVRLMLPGRYTVVAEKAGYHRLEAALEVTGERGQLVRLALEWLPGRLAVEADPASGVRVFVAGEQRGTTPLAPLELAAGEHEIVLLAEGYAPHAERVTLAGGGELATLRATLVPDRAPVSFVSEPAGATVRVDGGVVGRTPLTVDLTSGARLVQVSLEGYYTNERRIQVVASQPQQLRPFRLELLPGRLALETNPPGASVTVDGAFRGEAPLELELPARRDHELRLSRAGHDPGAETVRLEPGETRRLALTLTPRLGEVEVVAEPPDAELLVDGEPRGAAGQTLRLLAVPHTLELRRSGFEPRRETVTPRPGFKQVVRVRLRSQEELKAASRPAQRASQEGHELRLVAGGRFTLGAPRREPGRRANETEREVELVRPFYVATKEVTNAQFRRFRGEHRSGRFGAHDLGPDAHPVVQLTWEDAAAYCNWLSAQEGLPPAYVTRDGKLVAAQPLGPGYRLATEAEWERVARYATGSAVKYPWGERLPAPDRSGNYADEAARALVPVVLQGYEDRYPATAPVASYAPNALGFYDLGGNVAEWVHDVYAIATAGAPLERDPVGPESGELHVIRGSSYLHGTVSELRLSFRDYGTKPRADVGFRIARYAE